MAERDLPPAIPLLEKAIEGETHLSSAYYSLMGLKRRAGGQRVEDFMKLFQAFEAANTGNKMNIVYTEMGRLGEAVRDLPIEAESRPASREAAEIAFAEPITVPDRARPGRRRWKTDC